MIFDTMFARLAASGSCLGIGEIDKILEDKSQWAKTCTDNFYTA